MGTIDRRSFLQQSSGLAAAVALVPRELVAEQRYVPPAPVSIGVIGCGPQGRDILAELAKFENVRVAAVCEIDGRRLKRGLRRTRDAKGYENHRKMLAEEALDAIVVATPTYLHRQPALDALEAKKHVYCEAPMASSMEDLRTIAKAAGAAGQIFQVGHPARTNPVYSLARSFVRSGSIDRITALRAQYHRKSSWRVPTNDPKRDKLLNWRLYTATSSGLFGEIGSHQIDTIRWFIGKVPLAARGGGGILAYDDGRETPDTIHCQLRYPDGVQMLYDATLSNSYEGRYELFLGTMGAIKMAERFGWLFKEADAPVQGWEVYASRQRFHDEEGITLIADATKLAAQGKLKDGIGLPNPPVYYALESFLKSLGGSHPVACTALDGLYAAAVAIRANEAVLAGGEELTIDEKLFILD